MGFRRRAPWLSGAALLLIACAQQSPEVAVTRRGGALEIAVSRPGSTAPPCVKRLTVTRDGADIAVTPPLWELSSAEPARCATSFTYGRVPAGYSASGGAPALTPGASYLVEVAGPGLIGGATFVMRAEDGVLMPHPKD